MASFGAGEVRPEGGIARGLIDDCRLLIDDCRLLIVDC
jgi:hypothetical protein